MSAIRLPGKINANTTLLDIGLLGSYGITAVYLIRGDKTCLIDAGSRSEGPRLVNLLKQLDAFPPDYIILTHPHYDHAQGVPYLRRAAAGQSRRIEVLASQQALPLLADPSFNDPFKKGPYESIQDVTPVKEGDTIDLGGLSLRIYEVPGHCQGHIAILDEKNKTIFVGDALGVKPMDQIYLPPFMPPTWDPEAFLSSVNKLKQVPYESICLAHFGCISGSEARGLPDEAIAIYQTWWQFYEKNAGRLSDTDYLLKEMRAEIKLGIPVLRPVSFGLKAMLWLLSAAGTLLGRKTAMIDKLAFGDYLSWLATAYRTYQSQIPQ
jgi:glyoxylase-like metal-dependent hydrolase (beta-lactamase superfamily II)